MSSATIDSNRHKAFPIKNRKILHIDMDAFYASVEQRDNPSFAGKPLVVGGQTKSGVVAAASYEARKFGVKSAMPMKVALSKCPNLLTIKPNFDKYKAVSNEIRSIFKKYTDIIEPLSLDEAFLDVTYCSVACNSATLIASSIKHEIFTELNLYASAGVSYNKFLAKIASDYDKPNGLFTITPDEGSDFIKNLAIEDFFGVGNVTAEKFKRNGIYNGKDLLKLSRTELEKITGSQYMFFYNIARGIDDRPVKADRKRKSIGAEKTFSPSIAGELNIREAAMTIFDILWKRYEKHSAKGKTLSVKYRNSDFDTFTRSLTFDKVIKDKTLASKSALDLIYENIDFKAEIRLLGFTISNLEVKEENAQLVLKF